MGTVNFIKRKLGMMAVLLLPVLALSGLFTERAEATRYYFKADSGTSVGADGSTNLSSGNTNSSSNAWRTLFSTTQPSGSETRMYGTYSYDSNWHTLGTVYAAAYASDTVIAANPSATVWLRSNSSSDQFRFELLDYNPSGGAVTVIATKTINSPGDTVSSRAVSFSSAAATIVSGHRLALRVSYFRGGGTSSGRVYLNSSSYISYLDVTESAPGAGGGGGGSGSNWTGKYYLRSDTTSNLGSAGTANLPNGNTSSGSRLSTLTSTQPTGSDTQIYYYNSSSDYNWHTMGTVYGPVYTADTTIGANPTGNMYLRSYGSSDDFRFELGDYNPSTGSFTVFATATVTSPGTTTTAKAISFTSAAKTIATGHRLALRISYQFGGGSGSPYGRVYLNNTTYSSYLNISETVGGGGGSSATGIYYLDADSGTSVGGDGSTNLSSGNTSDGSSWRALLSKTMPSGTSTQIRNTYSNTNWNLIGKTYAPAYSQATTIGANPTGQMVVRSDSTYDAFLFQLVDYDPSGSSGNGTVFATATVDSPGDTKAIRTFSFSSSAYTIAKDHRLELRVSYQPDSSSSSTGRVYLNNSTDNSFVTVVESTGSVKTYTIAASAGTGGTISPTGSQTVNEGDTPTFTFTANSTYYINDVVVDGISLGPLNSYTFEAVTENHTIAVSFVQKFTITPSAGAGGSINPATPVVVPKGGSSIFSITPNPGYQIQDVKVNNVSVGAVSSHTITNIQADTTIAATFALIVSKIGDYTVTPPFIPTPVPPNVMIMLSVETPMQGDAYPDLLCTGNPASTSYSCKSNATNSGGRYVTNNYNNATTYNGYFNPDKCYSYTGSGTTGVFTPVANATLHKCDGTKWSGNFLNFATTMAIDSFRMAFTGGNRDADVGGGSPSTTLLAGRQTLGTGHSWYPVKRIDNAGSYIPSAGTNTKYVVRHANGFSVCSTSGCTVKETGTLEQRFPTTTGATGVDGSYSLRIKACDSSAGLETYCNASTKKPEGILQRYQDKMRFGLISYAMLSNADTTRDGGVIRANVKWLQKTIPYNMKYHDSAGALVTCATSSGCANPEAEINTDGTFITNPDGGSGVNSGLINYINKFGYNSGYKSYDPVSEMYYQSLRYFKNLGPSNYKYCNGITNADDGFAAFCGTGAWNKSTNAFGWRDPYIYSCSQSSVIGIQDANPWLDKRIPGTVFTAAYGGAYSDYCGTGTLACDTDFTDLSGTYSGTSKTGLQYWTDRIGDNEGLTPGNMNVGCVYTGSACASIDSSVAKNVTRLSQVVGTAPWAGKENSYYIAGLAYYARMTNLRPDLGTTTKHNLTSYFIDTQEPNNNMLVGSNNMLFLAAKYGGFSDIDGDGAPFTDDTCGSDEPNPKCAEWDSTGTGSPDNYMFASDPSQVAVGLERAFKDIESRLSSGTAASILNNSEGSGANLLQALFYPTKQFQNKTQASWVGQMQALWYYLDPFFNKTTIREDTNTDQVLDLIDDYALGYSFDASQGVVEVQRQRDTDGKGTMTVVDTLVPESVNTLWNAGDLLFTKTASSRNIKTVVSGTTLLDFTTSNASNATLKSYLQASSDAESASIIDYVRGTDYPRPGQASDPVYRSRTVSSFDSGGSVVSNVWKLGDIVSSSPKIQSSIRLNMYGVPSPTGYNDFSYLNFTKSFEYGTRGMAYVGANDGMLHAIKLGLLDVRLSNTGGATKARIIGSGLGTEQWAFIPKNVLPYLKYLADPSYAHIFSVDGTPLLSDVSINKATGCSGNYWDCPKQTKFLSTYGDSGIPVDPAADPSDSTKPHIQLPKLDTANTSWRTVLIGSMGQGGASRDFTDSCTAGTSTSACVRTPITGVGLSSYFALDVTDQNNPSFMWEFSGDPSSGNYLGYTLSSPAIVRVGDRSKNGRWFAVFASGPMGPIDTSAKQFMGTSSQNLKIFVVDIATGTLAKTIDTGVTNAFAGSLSGGVIDTDRSNLTASGNYQDDAVYIGYTQKDTSVSPATWTKGGVLRLLTKEDTDPNNWTVSTLISNIGPVTTSVAKLQDRKNKNLWVYFGTGRYFFKSLSAPDNPNSQESLFGIKDPCYSSTTGSPNYTPVGPTNAFDRSCTAAAISGKTGLTDQTGDASTASSSTIPATSKGWFIDLGCTGSSCSHTALNDGFMSERVITDPSAVTSGAVFFTTFRPTSDVCSFGGNSYIWAVRFDTGGEPPDTAMQGKGLMQVSTGGFTETSMSTAFSGQSNKGLNKRRLATPLQGMPPKASGLSLVTNPKPSKKVMQIHEK